MHLFFHVLFLRKLKKPGLKQSLLYINVYRNFRSIIIYPFKDIMTDALLACIRFTKLNSFGVKNIAAGTYPRVTFLQEVAALHTNPWQKMIVHFYVFYSHLPPATMIKISTCVEQREDPYCIFSRSTYDFHLV